MAAVRKKAPAKQKSAIKKTIRAPKPRVKRKVRETCFIIMPFGGWFDDYYETIYKPAIEDAGMSPCRADDLYRPSTIIHDIWAYTQSAKLILADLSGKNANVFYELGLAHALAKPAILITESMDDVPFDLRALRVLEYDKNLPNWGDELQRKITASVKEILAAPRESVLPAFLKVSKEAKPQSISEQEKTLLDLRREVELLRNAVTRYEPTRLIDQQLRPHPAEARDMIQSMLIRGLPHEKIVRRLTQRRVPVKFVLDFIRDFTESMTHNSAQSSLPLDEE